MAHRAQCAFGPGFYRIELRSGDRRYCQDQEELSFVALLLPPGSIRRVQRDGYCLDGIAPEADLDTDPARGVVDADQWLGLPRAEGMAILGLTSEADYTRAYHMLEDAVIARDRAQARTGVRASIVVKKRGTPVTDVEPVDG
jgi:hypothetical protein